MPWYSGFPLLRHLETIHVAADHNLVDFRYPVQYVIRPNGDFRGYGGRVESGTIRTGEEIVVLPSGKTSRVKSITTYDGELHEAFATQSVTLSLEDELDISRGDMIVRRNNIPNADSRFEAIICWMSDIESSQGASYILKHTTRETKAFISKLFYTIDVNTLHREKAASLALNEIGRVEIKTSMPVFYDSYAANRATGSFILIDPHTNLTVAGGMIRGPLRDITALAPAVEQKGISRRHSTNIAWQQRSITREQREERAGHKAAVLWLTGYSGSGKSTIARGLEKRLFAMGCSTTLLDGDNVRHGLCGDLGFSDRDRTENIRRVGEVARLFFENGSIVICTFISPFRQDRDFVRGLIEEGHFFEIYVKCNLDVCKRRDPRGLYKKALAGEIKQFTGIDSPYEEPEQAEIAVETDLQNAEEVIERILTLLRDSSIIGD
jgi:bifunctional enzyme CysN/CysC